MYKLPEGWKFEKLPTILPEYNASFITDYGHHFFYGRFSLSDNAGRVEVFEVYLRYNAVRSKRDSAIAVIDSAGGHDHNWMVSSDDSPYRWRGIVQELVRQRFVNDEWWYFILANQNAEALNA